MILYIKSKQEKDEPQTYFSAIENVIKFVVLKNKISIHVKDVKTITYDLDIFEYGAFTDDWLPIP